MASSAATLPPKPHALLLPYPETGHINPLMELAKHLASHGILITFVNTQYNHHRILQCNSARLPSDLGLPIQLVHIPDGISEAANQDNDIAIFNEIIANVGPALEELIDKLASQGPRVTCIISDVMAVQTLDVAKKLGIPRVGFWPPNASAYAYCCHGSHGVSNGSLPRNGVPQPDEIVSFPGLPPLPGCKVPWVIESEALAESILKSFMSCANALLQSKWVLGNSVHELEHTSVDEMPGGFRLLCPLGPILPKELLEKSCTKNSRISTSLWAEEDTCLNWLDSQKLHSVMYASLGSIAIMNKEQLHELAYGLEATGLPILWVVRHDITGTKGCALPEGFLERTQDRIRVVRWAPQLMVLSHDAVGGFLTHCGWNSTIEAMSMGIPMLAWPHLGDQFLNAELVVAKWGVGLELDIGKGGEKVRIVVERQVRKLMEGHEGSVMRSKALEIRQIILKASREGGSSHKNMQNFVSWIKQQAELLPPAPIES